MDPIDEGEEASQEDLAKAGCLVILTAIGGVLLLVVLIALVIGSIGALIVFGWPVLIVLLLLAILFRAYKR